MALGNKAINMWVLSKAKDTIFKVVELKSEGAHEDCSSLSSAGWIFKDPHSSLSYMF